MGPLTFNDDLAAQTLRNWFLETNELWAELYHRNSGGGGDFYVLRHFADFQALLSKTHPKSVIFVLRELQLPVRGVVNDELIERLLAQAPDGEWVLVVSPPSFHEKVEILASENEHGSLRRELESLRGQLVWAGRDVKMPESYWEKCERDDALILVSNNSIAGF